ncbi:hypothetical protein MVEN_00295300 [Mycena venus]|uniref:Uncharacterized protein n=1 Tax=Mycena venus TaxID=2733690 RepID=A0A8H7DEW6_9AGAR|nr:hypothetical protein MVEN_00295300 [Mycena venus]
MDDSGGTADIVQRDAGQAHCSPEIGLNSTGLTLAPSMSAISELDCQIVGDSDLYGLGVRISVYSQMVLEILRDSLQWEAGLTIEIPSLFTVGAMECVLILKAIQRQLTPFDAMVTLFMIGSLSTVRPVTIPESRRAALWGRLLELTNLINILFQLFVGLWATTRRMDAGLAPHCEIWIYTFSRQRARTGPAILVWIAVYVLVIGAFFLVFVVSFGRAWRAGWKMGPPEIPLDVIDQSPIVARAPTSSGFTATTTSRLRQPPAIQVAGPNRHAPFTAPTIQSTLFRRSIVPWALLAQKLFWGFAFNVAGVEFMLLWNDVAGVHAIVGSSGQVMALLIAAFTTVQFGMAASKASER